MGLQIGSVQNYTLCDVQLNQFSPRCTLLGFAYVHLTEVSALKHFKKMAEEWQLLACLAGARKSPSRVRIFSCTHLFPSGCYAG